MTNPVLMLHVLHLVGFALLVTYIDAGVLECWAADPGTHLVPTTFKECRHLIKWMNSFDRDRDPMKFTRKHRVGYQVPRQWIAGTCVLAIDMISDEAEDTLTFHEIGIEAYVLALGCVIQPPHLGGKRSVGQRKLLNVTIFGYNDKPGGFRSLFLPHMNETHPLEGKISLDTVTGHGDEHGSPWPIGKEDDR